MTEVAQARVAEAYACRHPEAVARIMEGAAPSEVAAVFERWRPDVASSVASRMIAQAAAMSIAALPTEVAVQVLVAMRPAGAANAVGKMIEGDRARLLDALPRDVADPTRRLLAQPPGTAGAVMDPIVPTVPVEVTASEAVEIVRATFPEARSFVYAVSSAGKLEGVASLAELAFAGNAPVRSVMRVGLEALPARATLKVLAGHPGWSKVHQLPVVAPDGRLLGVVRHEVVRRIEAELGKSVTPAPAASTAAALGTFYALGVAGLVSWVGQIVVAPERSEAP